MVQVPLEANEHAPDIFRLAKFREGIVERSVAQPSGSLHESLHAIIGPQISRGTGRRPVVLHTTGRALG
jgi:hypothetical protein